MTSATTGPGPARQPPAMWPRAAPSRRSSLVGLAPAPRSPRTKSTASAPRCAPTPRRPAARASGTTPTCWRCRCAPPARRCSRRSSMPGSRERRATTPATSRTSSTWRRSDDGRHRRHTGPGRRAGAAAADRPRAARGVHGRAPPGIRTDRGRARGRGPLERHVPGAPRRRQLRPAPPAAPAAPRPPPPPPPLPPSAHDVLREARVLTGVQGRIRTPAVLAVCDDESILGVPFYVMERVYGTVITSEIPPAIDTPEEHARICDELIRALVELHAVDWRDAGLEG